MSIENKYKSYYDNIIATVIMSSSAVANSVLRYTTNENIIAVAGAATATTLSNYPNFCRVIPDDQTQVNIISQIMEKLNWNSAIFLYSNDIYGKNGLTVLKKSYPNIYLFPQMFDTENDDSFENIATFVESNIKTDVVITFANTEDINKYFNTLKNRNSSVKKFYIGSDYWVIINKSFYLRICMTS